MKVRTESKFAIANVRTEALTAKQIAEADIVVTNNVKKYIKKLLAAI
jgi:hypothetical protein